jgi:hypothetical protein
MPRRIPWQAFQPIDKRRVIEAARRLEQEPLSRPKRAKGPTPNRGAVLCLTTSVITARSGASPNFTLGKGTGTLLAVALDGSLVARTSSTATAGVSGPAASGSGAFPPGYFAPGYFPPGYDADSPEAFSNPIPDVNLYHGGTLTVASGRLVQCKWVGPVLMIDVDYC